MASSTRQATTRATARPYFDAATLQALARYREALQAEVFAQRRRGRLLVEPWRAKKDYVRARQAEAKATAAANAARDELEALLVDD